MKSMMIAVACIGIATGVARAGPACDVPVDQWQTREALQARLEAMGWKIRSIRTEDGCYEAYAFDEKGKRVEAYFNPRTFQRVEGAASDEEG